MSYLSVSLPNTDHLGEEIWFWPMVIEGIMSLQKERHGGAVL